ncbi:helix-turn-helix domain-containing protein [Stappia sp.]|uniref:helix-turn-helix domain-containing protein n=1 Tax=Stappia sp. TaxID=1870903 RepID=UPI003A99D962
MRDPLARPEIKPKTPLAERLRDLRRRCGDPQRDELAKLFGVSVTAIATYERGEREPAASVLAAYAEVFGANLNWLLTGEGEMFTDPSKVGVKPAMQGLNPAVFRQVGRLVGRMHNEAGVKLPPDAVLDEQAEAYNALLARAEDPADAAELESLLPWLEARLRKKLQAAAAEPGTGKRQA